MKVCTKCKIEKELSYFTQRLTTPDGKDYWCKSCSSECIKKYRKNNKEKLALQMKNYYDCNKENILKQSKEHYANNKKDIIVKVKNYRENNREKINKQKSIYYNNKRVTNPQFKLICNLRNRLRMAIKSNQKGGSAVRDLGCSIEQLKDWLEKQFEQGMTWNNYGYGENKWNIDHIYPLSLVDLTKRELLLPVIHYTNLQPMWHVDNIQKSNKVGI